MTRYEFLEKTLRQIYGDNPSDDSSITYNLANTWLSEGIGLAARKNYTDNIQLDGIGYVNNSFYTTFKGISITKDEQFVWKFSLPEIPVGLGRNEGVSVIKLKDTDNNQLSFPLIPLSENQRTFFESMRPIPNKVIYYYEGSTAYIKSTLLLSQYTASVTMVSGGDSADLDSQLNVPPDYLPVAVEYIKQQLLLEQSRPRDNQNDGQDLQIP